MGHHINGKGQFQSDKYPELPPDKIIVSFFHHEAWPALAALAEGYEEKDPGLAADIRARLRSMREHIAELDSLDDFMHCDTCQKPIKPGDKYTTTSDDCYLCEEHAPTYADCAEYWRGRLAAGGVVDDDERQMAADAQNAFRSHVEAGGSPDDKPLTIMGE